MSVSPPRTAIRSLWWSRKRRSCSVAWTMKSERSRAASAASSPSKSLWPVSMDRLPLGSSPCGRASRRMLMGSRMVFEVGAHPLAQEHRVVAFEDPFARAMPQGAGRLVGLELVQGGVVGQVEQDHVVEVPAVRHVVPTEEPDPELLLVVLHLAREYRAHEELEEGIAAAADGEVGREHGHLAGVPPGGMTSWSQTDRYCRTGLRPRGAGVGRGWASRRQAPGVALDPPP